MIELSFALLSIFVLKRKKYVNARSEKDMNEYPIFSIVCYPAKVMEKRGYVPKQHGRITQGMLAGEQGQALVEPSGYVPIR